MDRIDQIAEDTAYTRGVMDTLEPIIKDHATRLLDVEKKVARVETLGKIGTILAPILAAIGLTFLKTDSP